MPHALTAQVTRARMEAAMVAAPVAEVGSAAVLHRGTAEIGGTIQWSTHADYRPSLYIIFTQLTSYAFENTLQIKLKFNKFGTVDDIQTMFNLKNFDSANSYWLWSFFVSF